MSTGTISSGGSGYVSRLAAVGGHTSICLVRSNSITLSLVLVHSSAGCSIPLYLAPWYTSPPFAASLGATCYGRSQPCAPWIPLCGRRWGIAHMCAGSPLPAYHGSLTPRRQASSRSSLGLLGVCGRDGLVAGSPSERQWTAPSSTVRTAPRSVLPPGPPRSVARPSCLAHRSAVREWPRDHATTPARFSFTWCRHEGGFQGWRETSPRWNPGVLGPPGSGCSLADTPPPSPSSWSSGWLLPPCRSALMVSVRGRLVTARSFPFPFLSWVRPCLPPLPASAPPYSLNLPLSGPCVVLFLYVACPVGSGVKRCHTDPLTWIAER